MLRIVILAISLLAGGAAAWLAYAMIGQEPAPGPAPDPAVESVPTSEVLVASAPIGRGEELGPGNLGWAPWPERGIGEGMVRRENQPEAIEDHTGRVLRSALLPGEPIRPARLAEGHGGLMSLMLTPGMRAVAVRVSAESGAGGFILPDDRVDIVHTTVRDEDGDGTPEPVSSTIIRNVRVLAVDQVVGQDETGTAARVAETATLELPPEKVELLTTARNSGQLSLALRPVGEAGEIASAPAPERQPRVTVSEPVPEKPASTGVDSGPDLAEGGDAARPSRLLEVRIIGSGQIETVQVPDEE